MLVRPFLDGVQDGGYCKIVERRTRLNALASTSNLPMHSPGPVPLPRLVANLDPVVESRHIATTIIFSNNNRHLRFAYRCNAFKIRTRATIVSIR